MDAGNDNRQTLADRVVVSAQAEFTPTPIADARGARRDLVYAVKIRVPQSERDAEDRMPVDVDFE